MTAKMHNASAVPLNGIERLPQDQFRLRIASAINAGESLLALFALPLDGKINLCAALGDRRNSLIEPLLCPLDADTYPAVTVAAPQAHAFEREIAEQFDILPAGHPWLKPLRFHGTQRKGAGVFGSERPQPAVWDYFSMRGEEVHEVAVGPVHAGVIEPGHFRFQCHGETVYHLEIQLGFAHRGVEKALLQNPQRRLFYMETAAGDTTCAHALAYCRNMEALADSSVSSRSEALRAIALELERLANHTGDIGALAGDVGYLPTMSFCGRLRGDFLNMTALLCGSRFGRGLLAEGGVRFSLTKELSEELGEKLTAAERDTSRAVDLLFNAPSALARFEGVGVLSRETAVELGLVGPAARASGVRMDARVDFPSGHYQKDQPQTTHLHTGDVFARALMRKVEIQNSIAYIRRIMPFATGDAAIPKCGAARPEAMAISVEEGWRGELCHIAFTGANGELAHYKIVDPSFKNWSGLAFALRDQQISDFPLCNKSFNLSYCGNDL